MNYLDRINQLNDEVAFLRSQIAGRVEELDAYKFANKQMSISIDEMRSQLFDARKQLESDSATIAKLARDKRELIAGLNSAFDSCMKKDGRGEAMIGISIVLARFADIPVMEYKKECHA